jgi:hypothetical protein
LTSKKMTTWATEEVGAWAYEYADCATDVPTRVASARTVTPY